MPCGRLLTTFPTNLVLRSFLFGFILIVSQGCSLVLSWNESGLPCDNNQIPACLDGYSCGPLTNNTNEKACIANAMRNIGEPCALDIQCNQNNICPANNCATTFPNNTVFQYQAYAMNGVGSGAYSTVTSITTIGTPTRMNAPTLSGTVYYNAITITWAPITTTADTGGSPVTYYYVDFFSRPCYSADTIDCTLESYALGSWTGLTDATFGPQTTYTHTTTTHFHPNTNF